ncbi:MAG: ABC transporter ATP-binding protein [Clostridiales Family XIII bacterium]|jgi:peptide/nickel transport system ATP-binding protein|nr:ABC transporter ATP-binding protein [Clostridiales Family XIII bacterium]
MANATVNIIGENNRLIAAPVLEASGLRISFSMYSKGLARSEHTVMQSVALKSFAGEIHAIVGSSGSGKSLLAHAILGILPANAKMSGRILYHGDELAPARQEACRGHKIMLIPQSVAFLDPLMRVGRQVVGTIGSRELQRAAFRRYSLADDVGRMYPFQLSGGMARRVLVSTALMGEPDLIVADEPTPGLSEGLAEETMRWFRELADGGASILLITHDLELAMKHADRITVFYAGYTVETAPASDYAAGRDALRHPYTKALIDALPQNGFKPISGTQPYACKAPDGCPFAERCYMRTDECAGDVGMRELRGGEVRCVNAD